MKNNRLNTCGISDSLCLVNVHRSYLFVLCQFLVSALLVLVCVNEDKNLTRLNINQSQIVDCVHCGKMAQQ